MLARQLVAAGLAVVVTFGLFYLMQALISMPGSELDESFRGAVIEFVRLKRESELELKKRKMPEREQPQESPAPPELDLLRAGRPGQNVDGVGVAIALDMDLGGGPDLTVVASDTDVIPIVRVEPQYPIRASERGIEGWVEVEFTISAAGTVKDPVVIGSHPGSIFNRAALRAIRKWKYSPKIENGVAVDRPGVKVRLTFELEDE